MSRLTFLVFCVGSVLAEVDQDTLVSDDTCVGAECGTELLQRKSAPKDDDTVPFVFDMGEDFADEMHQQLLDEFSVTGADAEEANRDFEENKGDVAQRLKKIKAKDIESQIKYANCQGDTEKGKVPDFAQGLWWIDGHFPPFYPLPHAQAYIWTYGLSNYKGHEACRGAPKISKSVFGMPEYCAGTMDLLLTKPKAWGYKTTPYARLISTIFHLMGAAFTINCNRKKDICSIGTKMYGIKIPGPVNIMFANMYKIDDNTWHRQDTWFSGLVKLPFLVKRVISCNGSKIEPEFSEFLKFTHDHMLVAER